MRRIIAGPEAAVLFQDVQGLVRELAELAEGGVVAVHPPQGQGRVHMIQFPVMGHAVEDIGLLANVEALVEPDRRASLTGGRADHAVQGRAGEHGRGHGDPLPFHEGGKGLAALGAGLGEQALQHMFAVEDLGIGADQAHMRIGFEAGHLTGQLFGPPQVVAVQKGHIAAPAPGDGQIAGRAQGHGLFAAKIAHAAGQPGMAPGYLRAAVRGAVVPEDDLEIGEGLGGQAVQGLLQMFGAVQAVHDDGDHGGLGHGDMMHGCTSR